MKGLVKFCLLFTVSCLLLTGCAHKSSKIVIQFASWGSQSEIEILKPILAEFEHENPDIKVDFIHIPQNYFQKIHLLFASNLAPDVIFMNNLYLPFFANAGVLQELKTCEVLVTPSPLGTLPRESIEYRFLRGKGKISMRGTSVRNLGEGYHKDDVFYKKSLQALSYNEKLYAIPRDVSNLVVYYNKDIFNKYNVPVPNKYWNFNDFLTIAQKLTKDINGDGKTDIWGVSFDETPPLFYLPYLMSEGGGFLSDDSQKMILNSPESQKGLNFYSDLRNKYHVAPTQAESASATMAQMFLQGKLAMQVSGRWLVPKYSTDAKINWNVINFPRGDKGSIVPLDASGWAITKSSKHKAEAEKLIAFLASKKSIEKFSQSGLIVPARIDVARGEFLQPQKNLKGKNPPPNINNKVFIDVIKTSKPTPVSIDYNQIQDKVTEYTKYLFNH